MPALYIVATPIGNLDDLSVRAREVLAQVDVIAAEDTRHSGHLLKHLGISAHVITMHDHNEADSAGGIINLLAEGKDVALISDAGTPLISDPGFTLVRECHARGLEVIAVPGPSAVTAALSVSGLPTDRFVYEGFLPAKATARDKALTGLASEHRSIVLFEAPHRIEALLGSIIKVLGEDRQVAICRELTKTHEQIFNATAALVHEAILDGKIPRKGEFVVILAGAKQDAGYETDSLLSVLLTELPPSRAAAVAAKLINVPRSALFDRAMSLKQEKD